MKTTSAKTALPWGMALALILLAVLVLMPLVFILMESVKPDGRWNPLAPLNVIAQSDLSAVFVNSLLLGFWVVLGASLLALPMAFLTAKTELSRHRWLDVVLIIPFMTPPYIGSMGWMLFMERRGFLEQLLPSSEALTPYFFSLAGMVAIMSLHLYPFLYLILRNAMRRIGAGYEEAGAVYGGGFAYRFRRILMPLLLGSYAMGALLVFVKTIAEFGTPATFGRKIGYYVLTSEIHRFTSSWPIDFGKATALASVLLTTCLLFWYIQNVISRRYDYQTVGGKGARLVLMPLKGWKRALAWLYILLLLGASIGIPYFSVIVASLQKLRGDGLSAGNFTLAHYSKLLEPGSPGLDALLNSLWLALAAATIAMLIGLFLSLQIKRANRLGERLTDIFSLLPNTVPGIVTVVGLILLWNAPWMPVPLYNTYGMVVLTYVVLFLPYSVQYVKAAYGQIDGSLASASRVCGGTPWYTVRRVVLPLLVPGMLAGWMMTFTISIRELVASLLILPPSMKVSATYIFSQFEQGEVSMGMAMAVVSVGLTTVVLAIMNHLGADGK
ncbi:iron ABC transporter permease [Paenibacillus sp. J5C_2022]|uniref:ABC transporter permease n=1 Tax=Paenibacillus sp. J5C2022 TaxID=2977129 RepID=UPI0021D1478E|nr:iron ABC transporter permease [Paenibacillus sp. J5C2022]MCU6708660.1 iron ABC transporter permease [Paenibacillus sp. J5C2022]